MTNYTVIDKLLYKLLRETDEAGIVSAFAALKRKMDATTITTEDFVIRSKSDLRNTPTQRSRDYEAQLERDLVEAIRETARWTKMAADYEHDLNQAQTMMAEHGWNREDDTWEDQASGDVLEAITLAIRADRAKANAERIGLEAEIAELNEKLTKVKAKVMAVFG